MSKTAKIFVLGNNIKCRVGKFTIEEAQYLFGNGFSVWQFNQITTNNDGTSMLLLAAKLNELGYKIEVG